MPPIFAESTEVLRPAQVGVTIAGGAGGLGYIPCKDCVGSPFAAGAVARVRVGLGGNQELGALAFGAVTSNGDSSGFGVIGGGALSYKLRAAPCLAFVADAGAIDQAFTGDAGLIFALYTDSRGRQLYSGLRGTVAIPIDAQWVGSTFALTAPIGFMLRPTRRSRVFLEAGVVGGSARNTFYADPRMSGVGGYGSIAVEIMSR